MNVSTASLSGQGGETNHEEKDSVEVGSRWRNLQKIRQKKQQILLLPMSRKLQRLAVYSRCQVFNIWIWLLYFWCVGCLSIY